MSDDHKAALAQGRSEGRAVRDYLDALRANKPKRGRKRTPDSIKKRLAAIDDQLPTADPLGELRADPGAARPDRELETMDAEVDLGAIEDGFVKVAKLQRAPGHLLRRRGARSASRRPCSSEAGISRSSA